jgi:hypothetical protein
MLTDKIRTALETADYKGKRYGHSYMTHGKVMEQLFPEGIAIESVKDLNRFGALNMIVTKLIRYCNQWEKPHQDSIHDLGVYAFILEDIDDSDGS